MYLETCHLEGGGWEERGRVKNCLTYFNFHDVQDHDRSSSSSKSSGVREENQMRSSKSPKGSLHQQGDIKGCESLTSPITTACVDQSNKSADIVGEVSADHDTMHDSDFPNPSYKKSITISSGPGPRHRTLLGRTSVSKFLKVNDVIFIFFILPIMSLSLDLNLLKHLLLRFLSFL